MAKFVVDFHHPDLKYNPTSVMFEGEEEDVTRLVNVLHLIHPNLEVYWEYETLNG